MLQVQTKMTKMNVSDLQTFMTQHGIHGEILHLDTPTPTVETAAHAVGTHPDQIVKSVLFLINGEPVLAIACGTARIDRRVIAAQYKVGRKKVKLADPETVFQTTGYPAGAVPPFGYHHPLPTLLDPRVLDNNQVYAGAGQENALARLSPEDILRTTQADVVDLMES